MQNLNGRVGRLADSMERVARSADSTLLQTKETIAMVGGDLRQVIDEVRNTLVMAQTTLKNSEKTMQAYGEDSPMLGQMNRTLRDLSATTRSLREVSDYLERNPEALLRGKARANKEKAMRHGLSPVTMLFAGVVAAMVAGCGTSPPAHMYTLSPISQQEPKSPALHGENRFQSALLPVEVPDYLDRSPIVTREGADGLKLADFDRWGGSLGESITTVLVENLSGLLASDRVSAYPGLTNEKPDFRVGVRILRLDCMPGDRVELKTQWVVTNGQERREVARGLSTFTEPVSDGSYETLVAAVSRTVGQLSREIAQAMGGPKAALSTIFPGRVRP